MGLVEGNSAYLGYYADLDNAEVGDELTYKEDRHLLLFGPTGCGKGTRILIPNLLSITDRSVIVIDPKGELAAVTADFRRSVGEVAILNPFGVLGLPDTGFSPLATLDPGAATFVDDATGVGEALIRVEGDKPHWPESARSLVTALLMWECIRANREKRTPTLENVRRLLTEADEIEPGNEGEGRRGRAIKGLRATIARMTVENFELESLISRFARDNDEIASIKSTADTQTVWMLSRPMRESMGKNGLDFSQLKKKPTTVYIVLPAERMETHSAWLRLIIVTALRSLYKPGGLRTLMLLDEFAQLGHLRSVENAFGLVRGYGVQLWPILQDLNQLKSIYETRWETFMANAGVVQSFPPNDLTTAKWLSERAGETTAVAAGFNSGGGSSQRGQSTNEGMSFQQIQRRVLLPQELMDIPPGGGIMFGTSSKHIPFFAPPYWQLKTVAHYAKPNPYYL